jgi:SAM-dependent methyltransferase
MLTKIIGRIDLLIFNNLLVNWMLILLRKDDLIKVKSAYWARKNFYSIHALSYDPSKSIIENAGYTNHPEIIESVYKQRKRFSEYVHKHLKPQHEVLDIGCGTGYFMDLFPEYVQVNGIDLNKKFLEIAKEVNPNANFYYGNYFNYDFQKQFDLIYLFGVLMYFEPSKLEDFFKRSHELLKENGIFYIQYQHAVRYVDLYYPDLSYVKYSPAVMAKHAAKYFEIEVHEHAFDGRKFNDYDRHPYYFPDGTERRTDTNLNNYLMIARKKKLVGESRN